VAGLIWYLSTQFGLATLATGDNPQMITALGVNTHVTVILGVGLSNALTAVSGALVAQNQGAADVNMGVGTIVAGLASVIIGETLLGREGVARTIVAALRSVVLPGCHRGGPGPAHRGVARLPDDLNLITAVVVVLALTAPTLRRKLAG
jgi:putative ABC transport system permease protein